MKVVILCGGKGTRLREETEYRPKPMVAIGERPMLWHIMKYYARFGHTEFVLCLGYKGEMIKDYFKNYLWNTCDVTLKLGKAPDVRYHNSHAEEDWTVTLAET
ncbi:MAG: NTP transferase domain-containing protein, partial [Verrucomicrobia bacterium]|nr:NTP transferase domain-containing protein [Verrucomicrobiota bacterium]